MLMVDFNVVALALEILVDSAASDEFVESALEEIFVSSE